MSGAAVLNEHDQALEALAKTAVRQAVAVEETLLKSEAIAVESKLAEE